MAGKKQLRWQDLDHSNAPLLEYVVGPRAVQTRGPIAEFLAKKGAERAPQTLRWYEQSLTQLWEFLEKRGLSRAVDLNEYSVNLFRVHLREKGVYSLI